MIFTKEHIEKIREGRKTETRRIWKRPHVKVGGIYGIRSDRFKPVAEDAPRIRVIGMHQEPLLLMTDEDAIREGCRGMEEFRQIWVKLHGSWDPLQKVHVVRFKKED